MNRLLSTFVLLITASVPLSARAEVSFVRDIAPILLKRCAGCHGEKANLGGYRIHTFQYLMKAGASGRAEIVPGSPEKSTLYQRIVTPVEAIRMPKSDDALSSAQAQLFRRWIAEGAKFDGSDTTAPLKGLLGVRRHPLAPPVYRAPVPIMALTFTPDGQQILVGGYNEATLWNVATGVLVRRLERLPQRIQALAFSPNGKSLLVAGGTPGEYGEVSRVDFSTGERTKVYDTLPDIVLSAAFSPNGQQIVAGGADGSVRVYDWESGKRLWSSKVHADWVTSVCFSGEGNLVASASKDMTVKLYEAKTGSLYTTYNGHNRQLGRYAGQAPVYAVQFAAESPLAFSAGGGRWIQSWDANLAKNESGDAADMEERFARESHTQYLEHGFAHEVFALAVQDGQVFAASADGILKQFDTKTLREVRSYPCGEEWLFALHVSPTVHRVAVGSYSGEVRVWDTQTGQSVIAFRAQPSTSPKPASYSPKTR